MEREGVTSTRPGFSKTNASGDLPRAHEGTECQVIYSVRFRPDQAVLLLAVTKTEFL